MSLQTVEKTHDFEPKHVFNIAFWEFIKRCEADCQEADGKVSYARMTGKLEAFLFITLMKASPRGTHPTDSPLYDANEFNKLVKFLRDLQP